MKNLIALSVVAISLASAAGRDALPRVRPARKPKALLIMLDGARADAVDAARMPAVSKLRDGSWAPGYRGAWTLFGQNVPDARPSSAANHTAIFTAVNAEKSRVFQNGQTKDGKYAEWPTWLARVTAAVPGTKGLFIFSWGEGKQYPSSPNVQFIHDTDANNAKNLPKILAAPDAPDAIQYFIDLPDHGGHSAGFYPFSREYLYTLYTSDTYIAAALAAIKGRPTFKDEDWLVMVTAATRGRTGCGADRPPPFRSSSPDATRPPAACPAHRATTTSRPPRSRTSALTPPRLSSMGVRSPPPRPRPRPAH